jgi:hypothetical protein
MNANKKAEIEEAVGETWGCILWLLGLATVMTSVLLVIYF